MLLKPRPNSPSQTPVEQGVPAAEAATLRTLGRADGGLVHTELPLDVQQTRRVALSFHQTVTICKHRITSSSETLESNDQANSDFLDPSLFYRKHCFLAVCLRTRTVPSQPKPTPQRFPSTGIPDAFERVTRRVRTYRRPR